MDLNNIELSPTILAGLYKDHLVEAPTKAVPKVSTKSQTEGLKILGENKKNILVLTNYTDAVFLPDEQLSFLTNILNACKISLGDVAIINVFNNLSNYQELKKQVKQQKALLFSVSPKEIGLPVEFPPFQVQSFDGCQYLVSPSLNELKNDEVLKGKLWSSLKRMFLS